MVDLDLIAYYTSNFNLKKHGYNLDELEELTPVERVIYISLMERDIREKNEEIKRKNMERQLGR